MQVFRFSHIKKGCKRHLFSSKVQLRDYSSKHLSDSKCWQIILAHMLKAKDIFLHDTKGGNKESHSSLRLLLGRRKHAVKKSSLPSPSVFRDRQLPWQQRVTSQNRLKSALSISLIVVKEGTAFCLHKQKRQTLWKLCMSDDLPRWKTCSKGGL